ncbi:helix-turn-helix transcriptional regulator [Streptomyces ferrugineus]|uniref:Helix-turn-helix transcriptional regulator n=1 Tax=Streptomyces ferrugineus TaxID=1413221 RepID=A0A7M2SKD0_9ACTN|nr:helix-turn-helix transcriptional regulator [Streptomyces ferrugineus]QOV36724.1 helix-turn-helix transcriptional regulator [Streptomyces ferrugineus]
MSHPSPDPRVIISGLLGDERLLHALVERDMGAVFRMLNNRGVSTRRLAAAADITQGRLYDYMNGKSRVEKLALFEQIADAFHIPGHLLGLARRSWEPAAAPERQRMGHPPPDSDDLAAMDHFRNADRQTGGGRLYGAVVRHLSDRVAPRLVDTASGPQVFAAAAALTEMAGWMAHDSGQDDLAGRHFARALPLARTSGDLPLAAHVAASSSHLALETGDPAAAVEWARTGLDLAAEGPRIPALTGRLRTMQARALAAAEQHVPAARALEAVQRDLEGGADGEHPWLSPFDAAALASESALILRDLERLDEALLHAEQAVALRETGRARSLALSQISLVDIQVRRRELDAAVHAAHALLSTSPTLGSVRVVQQLDELRRLLEHHKAYRPVREYLVRLDDARRARMLLLADLIPPSPGGTPA